MRMRIALRSALYPYIIVEMIPMTILGSPRAFIPKHLISCCHGSSTNRCRERMPQRHRDIEVVNSPHTKALAYIWSKEKAHF
jgi:hypothetical protein